MEKNMLNLSIDLETFSSVPIAKSGMYKYVQSPDFKILLLAYSVNSSEPEIIDLAQGEIIPQWLHEAIRNPGYVKHAYNAAFEWYCLSKFYGELLPVNQWRDTMLHGLYCGFTAGLDATGKALGLAAEKQKLAIGKSLIRYFCIPCNPTNTNGQRRRNLPKHDPAKWELFKTYCKGDVITEMEIEKKLRAFPVPDDIEKQWQTDLIINTRGVAVDMDLVQGALRIGNSTREKLMKEAIELTGLENPNSIAQLSKWLETEMNETVSDLRKETVAALLENQVMTGDASRMLEIRQELGKTSTKKYDAIESCLCTDGRVRGLLQFYGANRSGRWAGRLIQIQNLPRTYLEQLDVARTAVKKQQADTLKFCFGSVNDTLSQLIRTSFVASEGNKLIDADFSSIEARIISWLAQESWRLDVFRTHGKIYEASASQMFGVPIDKIKKGNPEYALRQRGKVAELALGYQGSTGALITMGALKMGIPEEDLPDIVSRWREANQRIVELWYKVENAAISTIQTGRQTGVNNLIFSREFDVANNLDFMTITLPSGRKLFYVHPELGTNRWNRPSINYLGINQTTKQWTRLETYGGKIVENCLSGDTQVLTNRGLMRLDQITLDDLVWDGKQWVQHQGLLCKGVKETISVDGIRMTPDHKIMTKEGWKYASSCERYNRYEVALPDRYFLCRVEREEIALEDTLRLWQGIYYASKRVSEGQTEVLRLHEKQAHRGGIDNARLIYASLISRLAFYERAVLIANCTGMEELRRTRYQDMRSLARELRELLGGYVADIQTRTFLRQNRREWELLPRKLQMGFGQRTDAQYEEKSSHQDKVRKANRSRDFRTIWDRQDNIALSDTSWLSRPFTTDKTRRYESVYDIKNAGPNHCFTVWSNTGPMIVHNCVQAIARDCLAVAIERLEAAGFPVVFHVHDEVVIDCSETRANLAKVIEIMTLPISWAQGLPLNADGWVGDFFKKD